MTEVGDRFNKFIFKLVELHSCVSNYAGLMIVTFTKAGVSLIS